MTGPVEERGARHARVAAPHARSRIVNDMQEITEAGTRLRAADGLPDLLAASFDAFEVVRQLARSCDQRAPELFAAFMMTADAAVDGREAVTAAAALPAGSSASPRVPPADAGTEEVTAALAALGALLSDRLTQASALTADLGDRDACARAAGAARRIRDLMAGGDDDRDAW